ncbi:MAG: tellurite resistance TerB family protein [Myxococcaceae bacterium]
MPPNDGNDAAVLLGSMLFAMGADGAVSGREKAALTLLCQTVPELRGVNLEPILLEAAAALRLAGGQPEWLRRKAYVLGLEVMVRGNGGKFTENDPNLRAASTLRVMLGLDEDFAAAALFPLRCKYVEGDIDDQTALTIAAAMLAVAAADGEVSPAELTAVVQVLKLISQFESRDAKPLLESGGRMVADLNGLTARLRALERFRDKTYVLASEVAHAGGFGPKAQQVLSAIEKSMKLSEGLPAKASVLFGARYGSAPRPDALAGSKWAGKLFAPGGPQFFEFTLSFTSVANGKVAATMDWGAGHGGPQPVIGTIDGNRLVLVDSDGDKKELTLEGDRLTGTDKGGAARIEATRLASSGSTQILAAELAGSFAAHALWSIADGGPLVPLVAEAAKGQVEKLIRFADSDLSVSVKAAQTQFEQNPGRAERAVLVVDGFVTINGVRKDALLVTFADHLGGAPTQGWTPKRCLRPSSAVSTITSRPRPSGTATSTRAFRRVSLDALKCAVRLVEDWPLLSCSGGPHVVTRRR